MSAIVGIFFLDGRPVDCSVLKRMVESVVHREPDRAGMWSEEPIGPGHRILWTTPESLHEDLQEKLPRVSESGNLSLPLTSASTTGRNSSLLLAPSVDLARRSATAN